MKKLVLITNLKVDKYFSHYFIDCNSNKVKINNYNNLNIFSQDSTQRNGLYLIEVGKADNLKDEYVGVATEILEAESKNGIMHLIENYSSFNTKEKCAILRLCKDFQTHFIDYKLDIEKALLSTQGYFESFNIQKACETILIKINKHVNVKIGDCDKFSAELYPTIDSPLLYPYTSDKYLSELKNPFIYYKGYDDEQFCSGYEMKRYFEEHYEKEWQDYIDNNIEQYRQEVLDRYKRHQHFRAIYEQFLERERQELKTLFFQENGIIYQYIKEKFPYHINQYHRRIDYLF